MKFLVTISRNSKKQLYNQIKNLFKNQVILRRGKKNILKLIDYAVFKGFDEIFVINATKDKNILKINKLKINLINKKNNFKWTYYFYDLNENKKIYIRTKNIEE